MTTKDKTNAGYGVINDERLQFLLEEQIEQTRRLADAVERLNDYFEADGTEGMKAYFRNNTDPVEEKSTELEVDGREELVAYIRYWLALGECPDPDNAEAAGLPMPGEITPTTGGIREYCRLHFDADPLKVISS